MHMGQKKFYQLFFKSFAILILNISLTTQIYADSVYTKTKVGNFGLPGIIDLPTGKKLPDGELVITQQLHEYLARTGMSFQLLSNISPK